MRIENYEKEPKKTSRAKKIQYLKRKSHMALTDTAKEKIGVFKDRNYPYKEQKGKKLNTILVICGIISRTLPFV